MGVASHLDIDLSEYDARIRTFVPYYEDLIEETAAALRYVEVPAPVIIDLGIGTGALAARCLEVRPAARIVGIDADPDMLEAARARLSVHGSLELIRGAFEDVPLPACDAIVATLALHHVPTPAAKRAFYARCRAALREGGILVSGDAFTGSDPRVARRHREAWLAHLERSYSAEEAVAFLEAWADEDVYFPLADEVAWLAEAGFAPEVLWRRDGVAVMAGL